MFLEDFEGTDRKHHTGFFSGRLKFSFVLQRLSELRMLSLRQVHIVFGTRAFRKDVRRDPHAFEQKVSARDFTSTANSTFAVLLYHDVKDDKEDVSHVGKTKI